MGRKQPHSSRHQWFLLGAILVLINAPQLARADSDDFVQNNLVSDIKGRAAFTDPNLVNPWGIALPPGGQAPFWISDQGTGVLTLYQGNGAIVPLVVNVPLPSSGSGSSSPTGQVFNPTSDFVGAPFIASTLTGTISAWNPSINMTNAILEVDNSKEGAVYTGLALANNGSGNFLYAADLSLGRIDVFNGNFKSATLPGSFTDPNLPSGYVPYNIQALNGQLYVEYVKVDPHSHKMSSGIVDIFDTNGNFVKRMVTGGPLDAPWGVALAPKGFGAFSGDLLVGNFGDGMIDTFNPTTGAFLGMLDNAKDKPLVMPGLWALQFGAGGIGGNPNSLYFTAGIDSQHHGLFGSLASTTPEPGTLFLLSTGALTLLWGLRKQVH